MAAPSPKSFLAILAALLCLGLPVSLSAQQEAAIGTRGFAEVSLQGYYLGGSQLFSDTSGVGFHFRDFVPKVGLVSGSLETFRNNGATQFGDSYLQLQGFVWGGRRWTFTGGDFRVSSSLVEFPFTNLIAPELSIRGVKVEASGKNRKYGFFFGKEYLLEGPRIPFHTGGPQTVLGLTFHQKIGERWEIGARFLRLSSGPDAIDENPFLFPLNRAFSSSESLAVQSNYKFTSHLHFFSEATLTAAHRVDDGPSPAPVSLLVGPVYETPKVTARANYAYQGAAYLPVIGQFVGDRRGPFGELRYRPWKRLEISGTASRYSNNLENDPDVSFLRSSGYSLGTTATLPGNWSLSSQLSTIFFAGFEPETGTRRDTDNRQITMSISKTLGRHQLHLNLRDIRILNLQLDDTKRPERERSVEIEDHVNWKHLSFGGAVRTQGTKADTTRNNLVFRGSVETHFRRVSAHAQIESGSDLANRSVFSTSTYNSTVFGLTAPLPRNWDLHFEAFRNNLITELNPESIFLLGNRGVDLSTSLSGFNQWSVFFRVTRQIGWGGPQLGGADLERFTANQIQLTGSVEGFVAEIETDGVRRVEGIPITLDQYRTATTDAEGHYRFLEVPEGVHRVALSTQELPAEYDPGPVAQAGVKVDSKRIARADLNVIPLSSVKGRITGPAGVPFDDVVIRLESPKPRYTTPDAEGYFYFYNLREGNYSVSVDSSTLPPDAYIATSDRLPFTVKIGAEPPPLAFEMLVRKIEKPVRKVLEERITLETRPAPSTKPVDTKGSGSGSKHRQ